MDAIPIAPLETAFEGYRFRSRLEARWAVFLSCLKLKYEYEKDGYALRDGRAYLPDFFIPEIGWLEVKGRLDLDDGKMAQFILDGGGGTRMRGFVVGGMPNPAELECWGPEGEGTRMAAYYPNGDSDQDYWWCLCPTCRRIGIEYEGRGARVAQRCCGLKEQDRDHNGNAVAIRLALIAARSARFDGSDAVWRRDG